MSEDKPLAKVEALLRKLCETQSALDAARFSAAWEKAVDESIKADNAMPRGAIPYEGPLRVSGGGYGESLALPSVFDATAPARPESFRAMFEDTHPVLWQWEFGETRHDAIRRAKRHRAKLFALLRAMRAENMQLRERLYRAQRLQRDAEAGR